MPKNPNAVALGSLGGKARKAKMTKEQLSESAKKAIQVRWEKHRAQKLEDNNK
jgi:hypothetical protein